LTGIERGAWPVMLRYAALRFWLSRLKAKFFPRPGEVIQLKEPAHFNHILQDRIARHDEFYELWVS
jgi:homoserine kinase type II